MPAPATDWPQLLLAATALSTKQAGVCKIRLGRTRTWIAIFGLGAVGLAARLTRLDHSFWNDESFNLFVSSAGPIEAVRRISGDIFPPLYNVLLSIWIWFVPRDELAIRALSITAGLWVIAIAVLLAHRWFGVTAGVLAGLLVALSPTQALWSQVARPFALESALAVSIFYLSAQLARSPTTIRGPKAAPPLLMAFIITAAAALYTSHGAVIVVFAAAVPPFWRFFVRRPAAALERMKVASSLLPVFILWLPLVPYMLRQKADPRLISGEQHNPDFTRVVVAIADPAGVGFLWTLKPVGTLLVASAALAGAIHLYRKDAVDFVALVSFTAVPIILCVVLWFLVDDIFGRVLERAFWLNAVVLCAAAGGFVRFGLAGRAGAGLTVALSVWGLANLARSPPPDWSAAAGLIAQLARPGEAVIAVPEELHYSARYYVLGARPDLILQQYGTSGRERPLPIPENPGRRTWLIVDTNETPDQLFGSNLPDFADRTSDRRLLIARFDEPSTP